MIDRLVNRLLMMLVKALISHIDDSTDIQLVKITGLSNENADRIERLQPYGLSNVPPKNSEALVGFLNGDRSDGIIFAVDSGEYRPKNLKEGENVLYSSHGQKVLLAEDGSILVTGANKVTLKDCNVDLGSENLLPVSGVVTGECLCAFTGAPHPDYSSVVRAKKV